MEEEEEEVNLSKVGRLSNSHWSHLTTAHSHSSVLEGTRRGARRERVEGGWIGGGRGRRGNRKNYLIKNGQANSTHKATSTNFTPAGENGGCVQVMRRSRTAVSSAVRYMYACILSPQQTRKRCINSVTVESERGGREERAGKSMLSKTMDECLRR